MQEKIENQNKFFLPELLHAQEQKLKLKCPNSNQADYACISQECSKPGLTCRQNNCQCIKQHQNCHHTVLDRVLKSIQKHQKKEIPQKVKDIYKTIYQIINQMIQKLSLIRAKFQREEQYFGLREEELQFIQLIDQNKIQQINGKIIKSLEKTFNTDIQLNNNSKEDIMKDFQMKRPDFDKLCNYISESYSQIQEKERILDVNMKLFQNSKIVEKIEEKQMLGKWLKQYFNGKNIESKLLFRASQHNFYSEKFHEFCDNKKDTIVIVKNEFDKIIGGFTSVAWHSNGGSQFDQTSRSFLFSLNLKEKYNYLKTNYKSIGCYSGYGPIFGDGSKFCGGKDLSISQRCNTNQNSFGDIFTYNLPINNPFKYQSSTQETYTLFTGNPKGNHFKIKEYEVFQITQA